jgi:hypothetical protein
MATIPPPDVPIIDKGTGRMNQKWYKFLWELSAENQPLKKTSYIELSEIADPTAPADSKARLYASDAGGGKTQLSVLFPTGAVQQVTVEP